MADRTLTLVIEGQNKSGSALNEAAKQVDGFKSKIESWEPQFKKMAAVGTVAFGAIAGAASLTIKAYAESQKQLTIADTTIKSLSETALATMGGSFDEAAQKVRQFGSAMQALGGIADEEVAIGVTRLTQITGDYAKAQDAARIAADLATFKQIDFSTATDIVGKVLAGNTGILARYGVQLKEGATAEEAMAALAAKTSGQYEAFGKTIEGQNKIMLESFGDLKENIGAALTPAFQKAFEAIQPILQKILEWTAANPELTANIILIAGAIAGLVAIIGTLGLVLPPIIAGFGLLLSPIGLVMVAIFALIAAGVALYKHWDTVKGKAKEIWDGIKAAFKVAIDGMVLLFQPLIDKINFVLDLLSKIKNAVGGALSAASSAVSGAFSAVTGKRAIGGPVNPGSTFLVGENGPELFSPSTFGRISPLGAGAGGGMTVVITGNTFIGEEGVEERIGDKIVRVLSKTIKL